MNRRSLITALLGLVIVSVGLEGSQTQRKPEQEECTCKCECCKTGELPVRVIINIGKKRSKNIPLSNIERYIELEKKFDKNEDGLLNKEEKEAFRNRLMKITGLNLRLN